MLCNGWLVVCVYEYSNAECWAGVYGTHRFNCAKHKQGAGNSTPNLKPDGTGCSTVVGSAIRITALLLPGACTHVQKQK